MVDRLRLLLNRPLRDSDRPRLFALPVALIVATAAVLALVDDLGRAPTPARDASAGGATARTAEHPEPPSAPSPTSTSTSTVTSEEGSRARETIASRAEIARAKHVARRFMRGYLRFSYGQAPTDAIVGARAQLRARLAEQRPRVPARERRRRPHVVLVQSDTVTRVRAALVAFVRDGERRYTVPLELTRTRADWRVVSVGS